jgi:hypothetical protein
VLIAIGSLVMAWLAVSIVVGPLLHLATNGRVFNDAGINTLVAAVVIVFGGLIYRDVLRRERPVSEP